MAPFFAAIISHGNTIEVPDHTFEEFLRQKEAAATGDPIALLLAPYLTYSGGGYGPVTVPQKALRSVTITKDFATGSPNFELDSTVDHES